MRIADFAHAAGAEGAEDFIWTEARSGSQGHVTSGSGFQVLSSEFSVRSSTFYREGTRAFSSSNQFNTTRI
jgi:hypothetical protein